MRVLSVYSGCGGMDLGAVAAGTSIVRAVEVDRVAALTYAGLVGHEPEVRDVEDVRFRPGEADLVIGGPPCQGFSVAGRMDPDDPRSRHVWTFLDVVERVRPVAFVMENVKALATGRRWADLRDALVRRALSLGFRVRLWVLDAAHFGVPQSRERMFLVGARTGELQPPPPVTASSPPPLRRALASLPPWGSPGNDTLCSARVTPARRPVLRRSPWAGMLFNGAGRPMDPDRPAPTLPASMGGNRTPIVDRAQLECGAEPWVVRYHAHLLAGGEPCVEVPLCLRRITVEEAAAIQAFPPGVRWAGSVTARYRQIGNACPPPLAEAVVRTVVG